MSTATGILYRDIQLLKKAAQKAIQWLLAGTPIGAVGEITEVDLSAGFSAFTTKAGNGRRLHITAAGGGGGVVDSVTAGDGTITIGGTSSDPTVSAAPALATAEAYTDALAATLGTAAFRDVPVSGDASSTEVVLGNDTRLGGGITSPLTTKGDLWGFDTASSRVPVGANDLPLVADSSGAQGVNYKALPIAGGGHGHTTATAGFDALAPASPAKGDLLVYNGTHWAKHTHGADGSIMQFDSSQSDGISNIVPAFVPFKSYNAVVLSQSPTAYWRLNDVSGAVVDSIGGNNLTAGAGWVYQRSPLVPTDPSTLYAYIQQSVTCIAIRTGYSPFPAPNTGDWSISFCYKSDFQLTTQRTIFAVARVPVSVPSTNNQGSFLFDASSERPTAFWNNGSGPTSVLVNSTLFDQAGIGRKLHYAMVVDGTAKTVTWYVDGCLASVVSYSVVPSGGTAVDTMIGNFSGSAFGVGGVLGEVAVWSGHKLTAAEVLAQALSGGFL